MTLTPTFADFSASPPRTANAVVRGQGSSPAKDHWKLTAGGTVAVDFEVGAQTDEVTLKVCALVSKLGPEPGYAPLDVVLNGREVVSRWRIPGGGDLPQTMVFAVPADWLRAGTNTLELRSGSDARTMLWLYRVLLESVWDRDAAERAMLAERAGDCVWVFTTSSCEAHGGSWEPGPDLRFHLDEGQAAPPWALSWRAADGSEGAVTFASEMHSFLGHARTPDGRWRQLRGELKEREPVPVGFPVRRFVTEHQWGGGWHQAGGLAVHLDAGSGPIERIGWRDQRGNAASIGLPPGGASFTGYAQHVNEGPIGYRGTAVGETPGEAQAPEDPRAVRALGTADALALLEHAHARTAGEIDTARRAVREAEDLIKAGTQRLDRLTVARTELLSLLGTEPPHRTEPVEAESLG